MVGVNKWGKPNPLDTFNVNSVKRPLWSTYEWSRGIVFCFDGRLGWDDDFDIFACSLFSYSNC